MLSSIVDRDRRRKSRSTVWLKQNCGVSAGVVEVLFISAGGFGGGGGGGGCVEGEEGEGRNQKKDANLRILYGSRMWRD